MKRMVPVLLLVSALGVFAAFSQDSIEAPDTSGDSVTNGPVEAPTAPDENIASDSIDPVETPAIEADGQPDEAPETTNTEVETAPPIDAAPAPGTEAGDTTNLP